MARFIYRMQNILNLKEKLETQAKNEFAMASSAVNEEEAKLKALYDRKKAYEDRLKTLYESDLSLFDIRETSQAVELMDYQIGIQQENLRRAEEILEYKREALKIAMQEKETQEKLKENAFEVFKQEVKAAESKEIDELVSYRFGQAKEENNG
ncbi:MAG: flagellar export protein FliJ [Lachnospiraceae bacterium]|nr:flagellar export protein FliJ [Lachnospiraceae bacterium]